jgi:hypothetical protein
MTLIVANKNMRMRKMKSAKPLNDGIDNIHYSKASIRETKYLMRSSATKKAIKEGKDDIINGRYTTMKEGETIEEFLERLKI